MKVRIEVGEPRGFDAGGNTNTFTGVVVDRLTGCREVEAMPNAATMIAGDKKLETLVEHWFAVSCAPITHEGMTIKSILFIPRYKSKKPPLDMLADGDRLVFNGIWRQDGKDWDEESILAAQEGGLDIGGMIVANASMEKE